MTLQNHVRASGAVPVERYYDLHPTEDDLMGESERQADLIHYLVEVLRWYYHDAGWYIIRNMNLYQTMQPTEEPLAPDVAVFIGLALPPDEERNLRSWTVQPPDFPPPTVAFEIGSDATWQRDLTAKPQQYGRLGVAEYYAYDPRPFKRRTPRRLHGWRYDAAGQPQELVPDERGWLWSDALDSWLVPDGAYLRLYDTTGQRRLTEAEYRRQAEAAERAAKEAEHARAERLAARLRELGIDPETLE